MHTITGSRRNSCTVIAALLLVMAWVAFGDRSLPETDRTDYLILRGAVPLDQRDPEPSRRDACRHRIDPGRQPARRARLASVRALAGLAATLAALCLHRRRRDIPWTASPTLTYAASSVAAPARHSHHSRDRRRVAAISTCRDPPGRGRFEWCPISARTGPGHHTRKENHEGPRSDLVSWRSPPPRSPGRSSSGCASP